LGERRGHRVGGVRRLRPRSRARSGTRLGRHAVVAGPGCTDLVHRGRIMPGGAQLLKNGKTAGKRTLEDYLARAPAREGLSVSAVIGPRTPVDWSGMENHANHHS